MKPVFFKSILFGGVVALTLCCGWLNIRVNASVPDGYIVPELVQKGPLSNSSGRDIAGCSLRTTHCSYQGTVETVTLASTSGNMQTFLQEEIVSGAFYQESAAMEENRWAVIDESLAIRFFMTIKACGQKLYINDTEYTVCGVVKMRASWPEHLFTDGFSRIYIPANSQEGNTEGKAVSWCAFSGAVDSKADAAAAFSEYSGAYISDETVVDLVSLKEMAVAVRNTAVCALAISGLFLLKYIFRKCIQKGTRSFWKITHSVVGICAAAAAFVTFLLSVPSPFLPSDNIFDWSHYQSEFLALLQVGNRQGGEVSFYIHQCVCMVCLMLAFTLLNYCLSAAIFLEVRENAA